MNFDFVTFKNFNVRGLSIFRPSNHFLIFFFKIQEQIRTPSKFMKNISKLISRNSTKPFCSIVKISREPWSYAEKKVFSSFESWKDRTFDSEQWLVPWMLKPLSFIEEFLDQSFLLVPISSFGLKIANLKSLRIQSCTSTSFVSDNKSCCTHIRAD